MQSMTIDQVLSSEPSLRQLLLLTLGRVDRVESVMLGMRLQAYYGQCFASARYLGAAGRLSNKAWLRLLHKLINMDLVEVVRRRRPDKKLGTYQVDFSKLWVWLWRSLTRWQRVRGKVRGFRGRLIVSWERYIQWREALGAWLSHGARGDPDMVAF